MAHSPRSSQRGCFARSIDIFVTLALRQHLLGLNIGSTLPRRDHVSQKSQYNLVNTVKISLTVGEGGTKHTALALVRPIVPIEWTEADELATEPPHPPGDPAASIARH